MKAILKVLCNWNLICLWLWKLYQQEAIVYVANKEYKQESKDWVNDWDIVIDYIEEPC